MGLNASGTGLSPADIGRSHASGKRKKRAGILRWLNTTGLIRYMVGLGMRYGAGMDG